MKRVSMWAAMLMAVLVLGQGAAMADTIQGKVVEVNASANSITISRSNPATGSEEQINIATKAETAWAGIKSLSELKAGDEVTVEAMQDATSGSWEAESIEKAEAEAASAGY